MKLHSFTFLLVCGTIAACSGGPTTSAVLPGGETPTPALDAGSLDATADTGGPSTSYPTANIGWRPRSGATPGEVITNLTFEGTKPGSTTKGSVSLSDFYDPSATKYDVVAFLGVGTWSPPDRGMAEALHGPVARVAVVYMVGQGATPGGPSTWNDVEKWRTQFASTWAWNVLDPDFLQTKPLFDREAIPLIAILDVRTMEIVSVSTGAPADIEQTLLTEAAKVRARPPSY
jgi:hypothetical protein